MYSLSVKDTNNIPTKIYRKSNYDSFMNASNQRLLTKKIYILHRQNNGVLGYLHFKSIVPTRMKNWILNKSISNSSNNVDMIVYLNKLFIGDSFDLYEFNTLGDQPDINVYRGVATIGHFIDDDKNLVITQKDYKNLTADDIRNMDVWDVTTTEVNNNAFRYNNAIPVWQRSMNTRHHDRSDQGYRTSAERASLDNSVYGYGDDMKLIQILSELKLQKNSIVNSYK
jgi:hypothetical protein